MDLSGGLNELTDGTVFSVDAVRGAEIGPYRKSRLSARSMRRVGIGLSTAAILVLFAGVVAAVAQPAAGRVARIGYLTATALSRSSLGPLRLGLSDLGYVEGRHYVIEAREANGQLDRVPGLAAELVRLKVDVIVAGGPQAAIPARAATTTIPIVLVFSEDPVAIGLVQSLARPGGNVTGLSHMSVELAGKRLGLLKEAAPRASRVAVFWDSTISEKALEFKQTEQAARALGIQLLSADVRRPADLDPAFAAIAREQADAFLTLRLPQLDPVMKQILQQTLRRRLPGLCYAPWVEEQGCLMAYEVNFSQVVRRQVAGYVDKLLKGAKAAELPVQQPTVFELSINLRTARAIGLTIPPALLDRADRKIP